MAHSCPDCGCTCYCCGDIDDIDFGETFSGCTCCLGKDERDDYDDFESMDEGDENSGLYPPDEAEGR